MITLFAKAVDGKIAFDDPYKALEAVGKLQGKDIEVTIQKKRSRARFGTSAQLRYYYGVIIILFACDLFQVEKDKLTEQQKHEADQILRMEHFHKDINGFRIARSMKNSLCNTIEREDFFIACRQWCNSHGLWIPTPNETQEFGYNFDREKELAKLEKRTRELTGEIV